jgi:hypothetical protein
MSRFLPALSRHNSGVTRPSWPCFHGRDARATQITKGGLKAVPFFRLVRNDFMKASALILLEAEGGVEHNGGKDSKSAEGGL